jgi:hypothetical protein
LTGKQKTEDDEMTAEEVERLKTAAWHERFGGWHAVLTHRAASELGAIGSQPPTDAAAFFAGMKSILNLLGVSVFNFRRDVEAAAERGHTRSGLADAARSTAWAIEQRLLELLRANINDTDDPLLWAADPKLVPHHMTVNEHLALPFHVLPDAFRVLPTQTIGAAMSVALVGPAGATFCRLSDARERCERAGERERWNAVAAANAAAARDAEERKRWAESETGKLAHTQEQLAAIRTELNELKQRVAGAS